MKRERRRGIRPAGLPRNERRCDCKSEQARNHRHSKDAVKQPSTIGSCVLIISHGISPQLTCLLYGFATRYFPWLGHAAALFLTLVHARPMQVCYGKYRSTNGTALARHPLRAIRQDLSFAASARIRIVATQPSRCSRFGSKTATSQRLHSMLGTFPISAREHRAKLLDLDRRSIVASSPFFHEG